MALNINIEKKTKNVTYFGDIRKGDFFLFNETLFMKLEEVFSVDEITKELEYEHDFINEEDICSNRYNCLKVGSECNYCNFDNETIVDIVDIDMNVRYVK